MNPSRFSCSPSVKWHWLPCLHVWLTGLQPVHLCVWPSVSLTTSQSVSHTFCQLVCQPISLDSQKQLASTCIYNPAYTWMFTSIYSYPFLSALSSYRSFPTSLSPFYFSFANSFSFLFPYFLYLPALVQPNQAHYQAARHKLLWPPVISITETAHTYANMYLHSTMENNTSSETQRYKSLFHSLPATFYFKWVLHMLNMHSLLSAVP